MTQSSKPPLANCNPSVPAWEKDFCAVVGSVPWWKVVEAKRFMYLYDRVVQWDDSAGKDAFKKAKSRFWAEMNGFPCDLSLPDPDVYIDDVDWDAQVDTELILDLQRGPDPITEEEKEHVVILDALVLSGQYSGLGWGTGWGDAEGVNEEIVGMGKPENSWEDQKCDGWNEEIVRTGKPENSWEDQKCDGWNEEIVRMSKPENSWEDQKCDGWNEDSWGRKEKTGTWDHKKNNNSFKTESWDHKNNKSTNHKKTEDWTCKDQGREWRKRGEVPRNGDRVEDCRWRNGRGRSRGGFQQHSNGWGWTESF
ncbi:unnamed protein product [Arabis nemorensis]|uniref:Uncharacterized protein n=1 Tax=Arabis nemorensis TaxID=586526 RepID=A0A565CHU7_9BRAS|nr:unnamed protein product [Arabis nemorensis]